MSIVLLLFFNDGDVEPIEPTVQHGFFFSDSSEEGYLKAHFIEIDPQRPEVTIALHGNWRQHFDLIEVEFIKRDGVKRTAAQWMRKPADYRLPLPAGARDWVGFSTSHFADCDGMRIVMRVVEDYGEHMNPYMFPKEEFIITRSPL